MIRKSTVGRIRRRYELADLDALLAALRNRRRDNPVFEAIDRIGLGALRPEGWEDHSDLAGGGKAARKHELLQQVRAAIWDRVEHWYLWARSASSIDSQRAAAELLRRLGNALAGDRRGRRVKKTVHDPEMVCALYYEALFRLQQARGALIFFKAFPVSPLKKVRDLARVCGLPEELLRDHLQMSEHDPKRVRPLPVKQSARALVARTFGITELHVANILARYRPSK